MTTNTDFDHNEYRRIKILGMIVLVLLIYGIIGYILIDGLSFTDAFLRVLLVFSTLGFSEATTQGLAGKWFTILLIVAGDSLILYVATTVVREIVEGEVTGSWKKIRMLKKIQGLKDHVVICGFGRVGRQVAEEVAAENIPVVVIDREDKSDECLKQGYYFVHGDSSVEDAPLIEANAQKARSIVIAIGNDSDGLAAAVNVSALCPDVYTVGRASNRQAEARLLRSGVDRVVMPATIGGYHMATMALRPSVIDFIDMILDSKHDELQIEEVIIQEDSEIDGQKIGDLFAKSSGIRVLAVQRFNAAGFIRPNTNTVVRVGDRLILLGKNEQMSSIIVKAGQLKKGQ